MTDFSVRSDHVDVEQIMRQIRSRIREKRGVDYTEEEIRELASVKLEKFLDPRGVRSDLLEQFRRKREASLPPNFAFEDSTLFETHRGFLRFMRRLLRPILKLFINPNPLIEALHIQSKLNAQQAATRTAVLRGDAQPRARNDAARHRSEEPQDARRIDVEPARLRRAARAGARGGRAVSAGAVPPLQPPTGAGGADRPLTEVGAGRAPLAPASPPRPPPPGRGRIGARPRSARGRPATPLVRAGRAPATPRPVSQDRETHEPSGGGYAEVSPEPLRGGGGPHES